MKETDVSNVTAMRSLTLILLFAIGCNGGAKQPPAPSAATEWTTDSIENLAEEAAREFDTLAAPVEVAAKELADEMLAFQEKYDLPPEIDWEGTRDKPKMFAKVDADGGDDLGFRSFLTEAAYEITANRRTYDYQFSNVVQIVRTGRRDFPFAATVSFEVTTTERTAKLRCVAPIPPPAGFRLATPSETEFGYLTIAEPYPDDPYVVVQVGAREADEIKRYSLSCDSHMRRDIESAPDAVRHAVNELTAMCDAAEPTTTQSYSTVEFVYNRKTRTWEGQ